MWRGKWTMILILVAAVVVRLIQIEQPFVDPWSWRQSDVAAIARNFLENGFYFSHPQIDWAGNAEGYVGTEFPILPFGAALCYRTLGVHEWIGRIQGVLFFAAALPFFYLLVRRIYGEATAGWATFFYAFAPLSIGASRAFMPDVPSLSLAIAGMYFFLQWLEENNRRSLILAALLISLALLIKLPTALIGAPLFYLVVRRGSFSGQGGAVFQPPSEDGELEGADRERSEERDALTSEDGGWKTAAPWGGRHLLTRWELWCFAIVVLAPSAIWYGHAHRIAETFYPYHFFGGGGFRIMDLAWYGKIAQQTALSSLTPVLTALAILGAFVAPRGRFTWVFHWWLAAMVLFIFLVGWGNRHQWYQLPLVPIAAVFAGCACQRIASALPGRRILLTTASVLVAALFGVYSYAFARHFFRSSASGLRNLGLELREATTPNALIIAATDGDPTVFYYAHRKGWHFLEDGIYQGNPLDSAQIIANLEKLRERGATHLVFYAGTRWWLDYYRDFAERLAASGTLVEETPEFTIYKLESAAR